MAAPTLITAIGAMARDGAIGLAGWLPWDIPEELAFFERTVAGGALVVGRATFDSMKVVPGPAFVVSRQPATRAGARCFAEPRAALAAALASGRPVFVIGGASVYAATWPYCHRLLLTRIDGVFAADTYWPTAVPLADWPVIRQQRRVLPERKTGALVICDFLEYANPDPLSPGRLAER